MTDVWVIRARNHCRALLDELDQRNETVDACIIAALETKLAEAEELAAIRLDQARSAEEAMIEIEDKATADLVRERLQAHEQRHRAEAAEAALELAIKRAADAEARLATAHDALHDWGTPEARETA